jgi:ABC-type uncharacterized transport system involved in gliding motility auxiliary subunit
MTARLPAFFIFKKGDKMVIKMKNGVKLLFLLIVLFCLVGCSSGGIDITTNDLDELEIQSIVDSMKTALENKDVEMFMSNISLDYSDSIGGTYESIYAMAQGMISEIEAAEEMAISYGVNLTVNATISNLIITDSIANADVKITINAKVLFITVYSYNLNFEVTFQKEGTTWKIISMEAEI